MGLLLASPRLALWAGTLADPFLVLRLGANTNITSRSPAAANSRRRPNLLLVSGYQARQHKPMQTAATHRKH